MFIIFVWEGCKLFLNSQVFFFFFFLFSFQLKSVQLSVFTLVFVFSSLEYSYNFTETFLFLAPCHPPQNHCAGVLPLTALSSKRAGATLLQLRPLLWLWSRAFGPCGSRAELLLSTWDLPRSGIELVSPTLAGGLSSTRPLGAFFVYF